MPDGWGISTNNQEATLAPGQTLRVTYQVKVPEDAEYYHAYKEPVIQAKVHYEYAGSKTSHVYDLEGTIAVLPDVSLALNPKDMVVNTADVQKQIPVKVKVKNYREGKTQSLVSLRVPEGWGISPSVANVNLNSQLEEKEVSFTLTPPATIHEDNFTVAAEANVNGKTFQSTIQEINYDHIGQFYYEYPAQVNVVAFPLQKNDKLKIGYIESGFDQVADYLSNAGLNITKLSESDINTVDLSQFDTIVVGIRAYHSRADLLDKNERLKEYVFNGGHVVMQYHKPNGDNWNAHTSAPYPLAIGSPSIKWRVTDEKAKVTLLKPESPLFHYPNKITKSDWDHWIQERGIYFPMAWDHHFETYVRMADSGEAPFDGGILMAKYGEGTFLYTNLLFYRQIQCLVPGGYRIFTNLISYSSNL